MSYLSTPRICFHGNCLFEGPTRNNLLAALDVLDIFNDSPGWDNNPKAKSDFRLASCQVSAAWDAKGTSIVSPEVDAVIGANALGTGKMADLDPEHRRVTDLVGMYVTISIPGFDGGLNQDLSGKMAITQLRDYWNNPSRVTVTAWQSILTELKWPADINRSPVLKQLHDMNCDGLSIRLTPIASNPFKPGLLMGAIGPWFKDEPRQFVAARRLITQRPPELLPFPVASFLVDEARRKLVVDLGNLPLDPGKPTETVFIRDLIASLLQTSDEGGGILTTRDTALNFTAAQWLQTAGIIEWDLADAQLDLLKTRRLRLTFELDGEPIVMHEHPSGLYIDVDRRSLRLNPGQSATVQVYARRLGQPFPGQVVNFHLEQQKAVAPVETIVAKPDVPWSVDMFGYPTDPDRLMNSEPREVLFDRPGPLQAVTDQNGRGELTVTARMGEIDLPSSRRTIDSQLYFLGEPDGWQTWGAVGPNNGNLNANRVGAGCALVVLVFNTHAEIKKPKWEDIEGWLERYEILFPAMIDPAVNLPVGQKDMVDAFAQQIYDRLAATDFEDVRFMPISRDLSDYRLKTILAYLKGVIGAAQPSPTGKTKSSQAKKGKRKS